jgi:hypothetical protein
MTVATTPRTTTYAANGATTMFATQFQYYELAVYLRDATGVETLVAPGNYALTGGNGEPGNVLFAVAPAAGLTVVIRGATVPGQTTRYGDFARFPMTSHQISMDRLAMQIEEIREGQGDFFQRAVKVPPGEAGLTLSNVLSRAGKIFGFDAAGQFLALTLSAFKGDKGDPGANVMAIGPWSAFETLNIPIGTDTVQTADTLAAGSATGTQSARYKLDPEQTQYTAQMGVYIAAAVTPGNPLANAQAAMDALQRYWRRKSANGRWFTLAEPEPWSGMFGTPGDGSQDFNNVMGGTDVWANMQAFIDYCVYFRKCKGRINPGTHRLSRGLQHGYGQGGYVGGVFEGAGQMYAGGSTFPGTTLVCDTDQDPILNISGDRDVMWENVSFVGKLGKFLLTSTIAYPSSPPVPGYDSLDQSAWFDPSLRASQDGHYNPYALVTLGAFDGAKPSSALWQAGGAYGLRTVVRANGNVYSCAVPGIAAAVGTGPSATTPTVVDGTVTWRYLGPWDGVDGGQYVAYRGPYRPAWLMDPGPEAYGNIYYGSFCTFRNCYFRGGTVGLMMKPGTNPSQDDFLSCERCNFTECSFGFSAGNHQLRSLNMQSCNFGILQCALTNNTHGVASGSFKAGHINACGFGASVDIFRTDSSYGEPLVFTACYSEGQFRLGQVAGSAGYIAGFSPLFNACEWSFSGVNIARGRAPRQLYNSFDGNPNVNETSASGSAGGPVFISCRINVDGAFGCFVEGARFINSQIYNYDIGASNGPVPPLPPLYLCAYGNATAGGLILTGLEYRVEDQHLQFAARSLDTGLTAGKVTTVRGYRFGDRTRCIPAMVKSVRALGGVAYEEIEVPHEGPYLLSKVSGVPSFPNADATELKIVFAGSTQTTHADLNGFGPGSVVLESTTGTVWAVRYYDDATDTLYAVAMNNYKIVGGVKSFLFPVSLTTGNFAFLHARNYTPATPLFGDFHASVTATGTNGSPNLTAVVGALKPGDPLTHANIPAGTTVLSVNGNTAVMTANATGAVSGSITAATTITNVATDHGLGSTIATSLAVGDYLASPVEINFLAPATAKITTLNAGSPGSIVLDQPANKTRSRVRLAIFRRPTLANV